MKIAPLLLSCDFSKMGEEIERMETAGGNSSLGSKVSTATRTVSSFKNIISKGR